MVSNDGASAASTIAAIDIANYERFLQQDEAGTRALLKEHRVAAGPVRERHQGQLIRTDGDCQLLSFPDNVAALQFAIDVQNAMFERNIRLPVRERMLFRVGVHDYSADPSTEDDGLETGIAIAQQLMNLAGPGDIYISGLVHDQARHKAGVPIKQVDSSKTDTDRVYKLEMTYEELPPDPAEVRRAELIAKAPKFALIAVAVLAVIITGIVVGVQRPWVTKVEPAVQGRMAFALPEQPSLVVLPFVNFGGNEEQWFADGAADKLTGSLARNADLFVMSANSAANVTGKYTDETTGPAAVAEALGVRYVLQGRARPAGENLEIEVALVDALEGEHIWSESYERPLGDVFAVLGEIAQATARELGLTSAEGAAAIAALPNKGIEAFALFTRGQTLFRRYNKQDNAAARELFMKSTGLNPNDPDPLVHLAWTHLLDAGFAWSGDKKASLDEARALAAKASTLAPEDGAVTALQSVLQGADNDIGGAVKSAEAAVQAIPNGARQLALLGQHYGQAGKFDQCEASLRKAMRLNPDHPDHYLSILGDCTGMSERYDKALPAFEEYQRRLVERKSRQAWLGMMKLAWLHHKMGKTNEGFRYYLAGKAMKPDILEESHITPQPWNGEGIDATLQSLFLIGATGER
jgi:adenylate cyclase